MASNSSSESEPSSAPSIESFIGTYPAYSPSNREYGTNNLMTSRSSVNVSYESKATPTFRQARQMRPSYDSYASSQSTPVQNNRSYSQRQYQSSPLKKKRRTGFRGTLPILDNMTRISDGNWLLRNPSLSNVKKGSKLWVFTDRRNNLGRQFSFVIENEEGCWFECKRCVEVSQGYKTKCIVNSIHGKITVKEARHYPSLCKPYVLHIPNHLLETVPTVGVFQRPEADAEVRVRQPIMPFANVQETKNVDPEDEIGSTDLGRLTSSALELHKSMVANAKNSKLADIIFQTSDGKEVYSNKVLLYDQSEAFNNLLDSATPTSKKIQINYASAVIKKVIKFRCGNVSSVKGYEEALFKFASEFSLTKLQDECIKGIESIQLTNENVCTHTITAYQQGHEILKLRCFNFLKEHKQDFGTEKLMQLLPIGIVVAVQGYYLAG